ncbi:hypothetical protein [Actinomadura sp. WMMA1423]|uniref:hypothetical protein n=1 Tax=Actinomadura sp. WMMA1423 TaxID=2591108 RepID=UPI00143DA146|nr:hypothetical protein [Actinomadura sp. WMMA1423]
MPEIPPRCGAARGVALCLPLTAVTAPPAHADASGPRAEGTDGRATEREDCSS